jgi:hypothetical protein
LTSATARQSCLRSRPRTRCCLTDRSEHSLADAKIPQQSVVSRERFEFSSIGLDVPTKPPATNVDRVLDRILL